MAEPGFDISSFKQPAPAEKKKKPELKVIEGEKGKQKPEVDESKFKVIESQDEEKHDLMNKMFEKLPENLHSEAVEMLRGKLSGNESMEDYQSALVDVFDYYKKFHMAELQAKETSKEQEVVKKDEETVQTGKVWQTIRKVFGGK